MLRWITTSAAVNTSWCNTVSYGMSMARTINLLLIICKQMIRTRASLANIWSLSHSSFFFRRRRQWQWKLYVMKRFHPLMRLYSQQGNKNNNALQRFWRGACQAIFCEGLRTKKKRVSACSQPYISMFFSPEVNYFIGVTCPHSPLMGIPHIFALSTSVCMIVWYTMIELFWLFWVYHIFLYISGSVWASRRYWQWIILESFVKFAENRWIGTSCKSRKVKTLMSVVNRLSYERSRFWENEWERQKANCISQNHHFLNEWSFNYLHRPLRNILKDLHHDHIVRYHDLRR